MQPVREGGELITFCMTFVLIIISSIQTLMDGESGLIIGGSIEGGGGGHHHYHCAVLC